MIIETGHFALVMALCVAAVQSTLPMIGAHKKHSSWMALASNAALLQLLLLIISFAALTYAFVTSDFSVTLVLNNSHTLKPLLYKVSGVWGNHEGSMLMWVLILAIYGAPSPFGVTIFARHSKPEFLVYRESLGSAFCYLFYLLPTHLIEYLQPQLTGKT